jgi:hypothetical protein
MDACHSAAIIALATHTAFQESLDEYTAQDLIALRNLRWNSAPTSRQHFALDSKSIYDKLGATKRAEIDRLTATHDLLAALDQCKTRAYSHDEVDLSATSFFSS